MSAGYCTPGNYMIMYDSLDGIIGLAAMIGVFVALSAIYFWRNRRVPKAAGVGGA